ncbi:hypothetical protein [Lutibacter sp.]
MKKLVYLFMVLGLVLTSACDPMNDIYTEIDAQQDIITGEVSFTMNDDDYSFLGLTYGNFSSIDDAKAMIPDLLTDKYPVWGDGSLATVTFKVYAPRYTERNLITYTVTTADYDAQGGSVATYNNFSNMGQIIAFLNWKYPEPSYRDLVSLTYRYYFGGGVTGTLNDGFLYVNNEWQFIQGFTNDEYTTMGQSYPNFNSSDEAELKIPIFLKEKFRYANKQPGDIEAIMYKVYLGGGVTGSYVIYYIYDGQDWTKYTNNINETVKFGHDGTRWVPDNTIKYTLTAADYALVGNDRYNNFDVRPGRAEETVEARLAKINTILLNNFPGMAEGQKFLVYYNVYTGTAEVWSMKVILSGGVYVLQ